jgi:hypothetical protein
MLTEQRVEVYSVDIVWHLLFSVTLDEYVTHEIFSSCGPG